MNISGEAWEKLYSPFYQLHIFQGNKQAYKCMKQRSTFNPAVSPSKLTTEGLNFQILHYPTLTTEENKNTYIKNHKTTSRYQLYSQTNKQKP